MELGWVDYSEDDRQRTMAILAALQESTAIDELGIGVIRDAFAARLFPATSTLLTKAKYFFLVPYALRDMEWHDNHGKTSGALRRSYDDVEKKLAIDLIKSTSNTDERQGIIGVRSLHSDFSGSWVKRGPGVAYWSPLRQLGIMRDTDMGYSAYFSYVSKCDGSLGKRSKKDVNDEECKDDDIATGSIWHIPGQSYEHWRDNLQVALTQDEAAFLMNQILISCPDSLYALILRDASLREIALQISERTGDASDDVVEAEIANADLFHEFCAQTTGLLPEDLDILTKHAIAFSDFVYGCRIRYNAQLVGHEEEAEAEWEEYLPYAQYRAESLDIDAIYELLDLGQNVTARRLYPFLRDVKTAMADGDIPALDLRIRKHEQSIKHDRAKIGRTEGVPEGWRSGRRLSYRFGIARNIVAEIVEAGGCDA